MRLNALGGTSSPPSPQVQDRSRPTPDKRLPVVDQTKVDPEILKAAQGMEGMFLDYMMKVMRSTVPKNEMDLSSPATEIYQGMLDSENVQKAVRAGGIGLADQIVAYLESQRYTLPKGHEAPAAHPTAPNQAAHGGTDESRAHGN